MSYFITTRDPLRLAIWRNLFGTDCLPVFAPVPRWQHVPRFGSEQDIPAYDLNVRALIEMCGVVAVERLAAWLAGRNRTDYDSVRSELLTAVSVPIPAKDCEVVMVEERPLPLFVCVQTAAAWWVRIVNHQIARIHRRALTQKLTLFTLL